MNYKLQFLYFDEKESTEFWEKTKVFIKKCISDLFFHKKKKVPNWILDWSKQKNNYGKRFMKQGL